jgi:hypothetical protein
MIVWPSVREGMKRHGCAHSWRRFSPHRRCNRFSALSANIDLSSCRPFAIRRGHLDNNQELMTFRPFDSTRARLVLFILQKVLNTLIVNQKV